MSNINYYVRFGKIPDSGKSGIYRGDAGKIGEEKGISCYKAFIEKGDISCILSLKQMHDTCVYNLAEDALNGYRYVNDISIHKENFPVYLITGNKIGTGSSGEPLLTDIQIISELYSFNGYLKEIKDTRVKNEQ